ncbi:hypothetical protein EIP91_012153 [Steccherinum ochraceum]|uniref:Protein PBN1 n=1 Tax=Steccherinum ochraceum TaxID=92696 RepID=A0A4R0RL17_9APHY|nr:hypothetical protein EIP91_012153 [Steccherinum ochraceum]
MADLPVELVASLDDQHGAHRKYHTRLLSPFLPRPCSLHIRYHFPADIYVDPYELEDLWAHPFWLNDTVNLEHPVRTGSTLHPTELQVALKDVAADSEILLTVPVHVRYGLPSSDHHSSVVLPQPTGVWSCPSDGVESSLPDPAFHHIPPLQSSFQSSKEAAAHVTIPLGSPAHLAYVEQGTAVVVTATFLYLLSVFFTTARRLYASKTELKSI